MSFIDLLARISAIELKLHKKLAQVTPFQLAVVTDNVDPENRRRIKVSREIQAGLSQSYWINCGRSTTFTDEPIPSIGTTVLIACVDNNPDDFYYIRSLTNETNPPDDRQTNPILDHTTEILGDERHSTNGNFSEKIYKEYSQNIDGNATITVNGDNLSINSTTGDIKIAATKNVVISNASGVSFTLFENGSILVQDNAGRKIYLGGISDNNCYWDLNNTSINMKNVGDFTINNKSIATIGALDSRGDTLINRGY